MPDVRQLLADAGGPNPRLALASVKALADELDWLLVRAVHLARAEHYDWARIGRLLGVSRQAARQRFERLAPLVGPLPPHVRGRTPGSSSTRRSSSRVRMPAAANGSNRSPTTATTSKPGEAALVSARLRGRVLSR